MILGLMSVAAIVFMLSLLYRLSVHALPFWGALTAGWIAYATGAGLIGAGIVALIAGSVLIGLSDAIYASLHTRWARAAFAAPFAAAAAFAGYHATRGILGWSVDNPVWLTVFSLVTAATTGFMAWIQLAERASALSETSQPLVDASPKLPNRTGPTIGSWPARQRRR